jgi:anti-sigma-K factor RskA
VNDHTQLHDEQDEQLELYVLNLLEDDEAAALERRIAADPLLRERVRELRGAAALLAVDLEPIEPSPALRSRILDAARADLDPPAAVVTAAPVDLGQAREARAQRNGARWLPWSMAAALAVALVASLLWNMRLRDDLDERTAAVTHDVQGSGPAAATAGEVVVLDGDGVALLTLSGLPPLEPGQVYQVWLIDDGAPQPNVIFQPSNQGFASVAVSGPVMDYRLLAITVEPDGGSPAPTTDPIISGELGEPTDG